MFSLCLCVLLLFIVPAFSTAATKSFPGELRSFLVKQIQLNEKELAAIQSGQSIVKTLPTARPEEIAIFGTVYMDVSPEYYLARFRDIVKFESGPGVLQNGAFSTPPRLSDVSNLRWENDDLEKIRDCKPDDCTARLPGGNVTQFHKEVNWSSVNAIEQSNDLMRRLTVEYIRKYQSVGDDALTAYWKDGRLLSVKEGTRQLLQNTPYLHHYFPELASYLCNFPREKNPDAEDLFYWQKAEFGLQPVIRFSHVVILRLTNSSQTNYVIASKMLFANHYFRDGLELRSLVSDPQNGTSKGFYFLVLNRSHVDGMTGLKGVLIRNQVVNKSKEALEKWLMKAKTQMEKDFNR